MGKTRLTSTCEELENQITPQKAILNILSEYGDDVQSVVVPKDQLEEAQFEVKTLRIDWEENGVEEPLLPWILDHLEQKFDVEYFPSELVQL